MSINIPEYLTTASQKFYGVDVASASMPDLWKDFLTTLSQSTKDYLALISSRDRDEVHAAVNRIALAAATAMTADGETAPNVMWIVAQLTDKLLLLRGTDQLTGLESTNASVIETTLLSIAPSTVQQFPDVSTLITYMAGVIADTGAAPTLKLWNEFLTKTSTQVKDYLTLQSSDNRDNVRAVFTSLFKAEITQMFGEGVTPPDLPDLASNEVQVLIDTLSRGLVINRGDAALDGLLSTDPDVVNTTLSSLCPGLTLSPEVVTLLSRAAAAIAETGASLPVEYQNFLSSAIEAEHVSEATVAISPHEAEMRRIMFEIFSLALDMIRVLQTTSTLEGTLLYYYANVQREYVDMMSQTQMYGPTPKTRIIVNSQDFGKTALGYGNITVRSVVDYLYNQIKDTTGAQTITYSSTGETYVGTGDFTDQYNVDTIGVLEFKLIRDSKNGYEFQIQVPSEGAFYTLFSTKRLSDDGTSFSATNDFNKDSLYYVNSNLTGTQQTADLISRMMAHLTKEWNETPDTTTIADIPGSTSPDLLSIGSVVIDNFGDLKTQWSSAATQDTPANVYFTGPVQTAWENMFSSDYGDTDKLAAAASRASSFRSETSAVLQTYLETARSLKQIASDASKRADSVLSQIKESIQNQENLVQSISESLRGILSAIFR